MGSNQETGMAAGLAAGREYVSVVADYMPDGTVKPVSMKFSDGSTFAISGITDVVHMSTTKQNGAETRYSVKVGGCEHYLFFEDAGRKILPRWFVLD